MRQVTSHFDEAGRHAARAPSETFEGRGSGEGEVRKSEFDGACHGARSPGQPPGDHWVHLTV